MNQPPDDRTITDALGRLSGWRRVGGELHCRYELRDDEAAAAFASRVATQALAGSTRVRWSVGGAQVAIATTDEGQPTAAALALAQQVVALAGAAAARPLPADTRADATGHGLWVPPGHFYSPICDQEELRADAPRLFAKGPRELPGIDLRLPQQLALARTLARYYGEEDFPAEPRAGRRYCLDNEYFPYGDAFALFAMLRHLQPRRVVEVGSGWSSAVLLDTDERFLGGRIACTFVEPFPDRLLALLQPQDHARVRLLRCRVQDVALDEFRALQANDILFVDSSHVCKTGSDVHHLVFTVLPLLASGVRVHFHDVHAHFEYPPEWVHEGRAWNESYLLRAFLMHNDAWSIELHGATLAEHAAHELLPLMPRLGSNVGGSLWLVKR